MEITVLCKVVDNFGDIGVVYRLCRSLSELDPSLKLNIVVSDLGTFRKMAGEIDHSLPFQKFRGWNIFDWNDHDACFRYFSENLPLMILECFQCGRPEWLEDILFTDGFSASGKIARIVNIEYLTAEDWADGFHLLRSGTRSASVKKVNFMPGFTDRTGGLILDRNFMMCRDDRNHRERLLSHIAGKIQLSENDFKILVFSYPKNFTFFFDAVNEFAMDRNVRVFVAPGAGLGSFKDAAGKNECKFSVTYLPYMNQEVWDAFLCSMDFLFVRGEDSFARAVLAGKPFLWNIYPQDEEFHLVKLKAFLDRLGCPGINEFSWLYNRNFSLEEGNEAIDAWGKISGCSDEKSAQERMSFLLKKILHNMEENSIIFEKFSAGTIALGNLSEKLLEFLPVMK